MKVVVIGGGPSGLVTLKYLLNAHLSLDSDPIEVRLFELDDTIGGVFATRVYADAESSKDGRVFSWDCDAVAVCSGLHKEPKLPVIPGLHHVPEVIHSSDFKTKSQFGTNKTVMVIGSGETGADIAYLAVMSPMKQVLMCHKDGFHFAPKRNPGPVLLPILGRKPTPNEPGIPIDVSRANLFDTTYVQCPSRAPQQHDTLGLLLLLYQVTALGLLWYHLGYGPVDWGDQQGPSSSVEERVVLSLPSECNLSSHPFSFFQQVDETFVQTPIPDTHGKQVDLAPLPKIINKDGTVEFIVTEDPSLSDSSIKSFDLIWLFFALATNNLFPSFESYSNSNRNTLHRLPSLGAISPLAEMQAQLWVLNLVSPHKVANLKAEDEHHYRLHTKSTDRVTYGVDHESYAYQLALDMNSAPDFTDILSRASLTKIPPTFRLSIIWAFGAHFNTKFRLIGPWAWEGAEELLVSNEFWETITRRPILFDPTLKSRPVPQERHFLVRSFGDGGLPDARQNFLSIKELKKQQADAGAIGNRWSVEVDAKRLYELLMEDEDTDLSEDGLITGEKTWGPTIVVTTYSDKASKDLDQAITNLVETIRRYFLRCPQTALFAREAVKRLELKVLEDKDLLENASDDRVREEFNAYVRTLRLFPADLRWEKDAQRWHKDNLNRPSAPLRYGYCILLDEETIGTLAGINFPDDLNSDKRLLKDISVKLVDRGWRYPEEADNRYGHDPAVAEVYRGTDMCPLIDLPLICADYHNWQHLDDMFPLRKYESI
ncbi:hypothetical protein FGRA07_08147 [Fusarium graminearum]|nr:hypothetical protein FGRA07_08147 [Fusarium graminearum]